MMSMESTKNVVAVSRRGPATMKKAAIYTPTMLRRSKELVAKASAVRKHEEINTR